MSGNTPGNTQDSEMKHAGRCAGRSTMRPDIHRATPTLEVLLLLWDEMDDWLHACRHLLLRQFGLKA